MPNQVISVIVFIMSGDFALFIVIIDAHTLGLDVELSLFNLIGRWQVLVKFILLSHLVDQDLATVIVFLESKRLIAENCFRREGDTAIDELIGPILVLLNDLVLFVKELFSKDKTILLTVMVEVELSIASILTDLLFPVIVLE